jgi:hypothetical protein
MTWDTKQLKGDIAIALIGLAIGFILGLALPHIGEKKSIKAMTSVDATVPVHEVTTAAPIKALDKKELTHREIIDAPAVASVQKEILATATVKDDSGTRHVAAALDTETGLTQIVDRRPLAEWMGRNEIGLGYGIGDGGMDKAIMYERTFMRVQEFYGSIEARITDPEKDRTRWSAMFWLKYHF